MTLRPSNLLIGVFGMADDKKSKAGQDRASEFIDIHREVVEEAVSSGFGIFSTPGKSDDSEDKRDE
jgi:hypothetical protein